MAAETVASFTPALKVIYTQSRLDLLFYKNRPFAAMLNKKSDFYGEADGLKVTVHHGPSQGRGGTFAAAKANAGTDALARFSLVRRSDYQVIQLENEVIEASSNNMGALVSSFRLKMDAALENLSKNYSVMLWGNGGGARGRIASISTNTVTLTNKADIVKFEKGMVMVSSDEDGTAGSLTLGAALTVSAVDRSAGTVTFGAATNLDNNDYLFQEGDVIAGSGGNVITGVPGWIPYATPGTLFGVDRTVDPVRLGGVRIDGSSLPIAEAIKELIAQIHTNGGRPDVVWMNPVDAVRLDNELEGRARYDKVTGNASLTAKIGFSGMKFMSAVGEITCMTDPDVPQGYAWALQMDTWTFHSLLGVPRVLRADNPQGGLTLEGSDVQEYRAVYRGNLGCHAPGYNGVVKLATAA